MPYVIARDALHAFVDRQVRLIESTPVPTDLASLVPGEDIGDEEIHAVWLGAGLATQLGLALVHAPERFVSPGPPARPERAGPAP